METVTTCLLCGCDQTAPLFTCADFWLDRKTVTATFVRCRQCGLVYQNPRPSAQEMPSHYPPEYEVFQDGRQRTGFVLRYGMRKRSRFVTRFKPRGRLLDVGCAGGNFLEWMQQIGGWEVSGVETGESAADQARQKGLNVTTGDLFSAAYTGAYFDAVTLWDVIEHVPDPLALLREVHRILKPDGILVMRLPNIDSLDARWFGRYWAGLDAPRHLYVFGLRTLDQLLRQSGFAAVQRSTQVGGYLNFVKSIRFLFTGRGVDTPVARLLLRLLASSPVRLTLLPVFYLKDLNLRGSELVVAARKEGTFEKSA